MAGKVKKEVKKEKQKRGQLHGTPMSISGERAAERLMLLNRAQRHLDAGQADLRCAAPDIGRAQYHSDQAQAIVNEMRDIENSLGGAGGDPPHRGAGGRGFTGGRGRRPKQPQRPSKRSRGRGGGSSGPPGGPGGPGGHVEADDEESEHGSDVTANTPTASSDSDEPEQPNSRAEPCGPDGSLRIAPKPGSALAITMYPSRVITIKIDQ